MKTLQIGILVLLVSLLAARVRPASAAPLPVIHVKKVAQSQKWYPVGHGILRIRSVSVGIVAEVGLFGGSEHSAHRLCMVRIQIKNPSNNKILEYHPYSGDGKYAVSDKFGNSYKPIDCHGWPVGQLFNKKRIYPRKAINDMLVFQRPVSAATRLIIRFKGSALGGRSFKTVVVNLHPHKTAPAQKP